MRTLTQKFAPAFALALIAALPAAAQDTTAQNDESQITSQDEQIRTNPDAEAWTEASGLTITGTVQSVDGDMITLDTTTGVQHIRLEEEANRPATLQVGDRVAVDYTRTTQGVMMGQEVRPWSAAEEDRARLSQQQLETSTDTTGTMTGPDTAGTTQLDTSAQADLDADMDAGESDLQAGMTADADVDTNLDTDADMSADFDADAGADADFDTETTASLDTDDELPRTGSSLPLVALGGLIALGGAAALRFLR